MFDVLRTELRIRNSLTKTTKRKASVVEERILKKGPAMRTALSNENMAMLQDLFPDSRVEPEVFCGRVHENAHNSPFRGRCHRRLRFRLLN